jgi:hypothetical protein
MYVAGKAMPNVVPTPGARVQLSWPLVSVSIASVCTLSGTGPRSCWTCKVGAAEQVAEQPRHGIQIKAARIVKGRVRE